MRRSRDCCSSRFMEICPNAKQELALNEAEKPFRKVIPLHSGRGIKRDRAGSADRH